MISSQNMTRGSYDSTEDNTQDLSSVKSYNLKSEPKSGAGVGVLDGFLYCKIFIHQPTNSGIRQIPLPPYENNGNISKNVTHSIWVKLSQIECVTFLNIFYRFVEYITNSSEVDLVGPFSVYHLLKEERLEDPLGACESSSSGISVLSKKALSNHRRVKLSVFHSEHIS